MTQSHSKKLGSGLCSSLEGNHNNKLIHQEKQNKKRKIKKHQEKKLAGPCSDFKRELHYSY